MKIGDIARNGLRPADWRTNVMLKPDFDLLKSSMMDFGWIYPIVVKSDDMTIIDGFHRWVVSSDSSFTKKYGNTVPCRVVECDTIDAMLMHIRLNRAKGSIFAKPFSSLLKSIVLSNKYTEEELGHILKMSDDELDLMLSGGLLKHRKIQEHSYSRAWVPVEAPTSDKIDKIIIERPPNEDR